MFNFTLEERDRRWKNVREAMRKRSLGALVVWSSFGNAGTRSSNLRYLSNTKTEGYLVFPLEGEPTVIAFTRRPQPLSWVADFRAGHPEYSRTILDRLRELRLESATLGIVGLSGYEGQMGFPYATYVALLRELPRAHLEDATDILERTRIVKSNEEIKCLELGCEAASKVFQAVVETAGAGVKDYEVIAAMRNTLYRNGCEPDSMVLYYSGKELFHGGQGAQFQPPSEKSLQANDIILTEFDGKYLGYMAQHNQPFSLGAPDREWNKVLGVATEAFNTGLRLLKPGLTGGELDDAMLSPIKRAGYINLNPAFHGLGLSLEEPFGSFPVQPTYKPDRDFVIQANMVLEPEPHVVSPDLKRGVHLGCPVLITPTGCRLLTPNWQPEIKIAGQ